MKYGIVKDIILYAVILLVQILILNHIHLFGVATPLLYVYLIMLLKRNCPRWALLLIAFVMGVIVDIFSDTSGIATVSMTLIGFIRPYILMALLSREAEEDMAPTMENLGTARFFYYTLIVVTIYCLVFFTLEAFCFYNWPQWLACTLSSTILTTMLILVIENARKL